MDLIFPIQKFCRRLFRGTAVVVALAGTSPALAAEMVPVVDCWLAYSLRPLAERPRCIFESEYPKAPPKISLGERSVGTTEYTDEFVDIEVEASKITDDEARVVIRQRPPGPKDERKENKKWPLQSEGRVNRLGVNDRQYHVFLKQDKREVRGEDDCVRNRYFTIYCALKREPKP